MRTFLSSPGWWIDKTLLWLEDYEVPKVLQLGCSHPRRAAVTQIQDSHDRWLCLNPACGLEWFSSEPYR